MRTIHVILLTILAFPITVKAQSFDSGEGCLNVIDLFIERGLGEYGDKCFSANYLHERFINERFCIGGGIGYNHHKEYNFSAIPVYLSTHYFFLDKRFSPFVNLRIGAFGMFGKKNVDTNMKHSISSKSSAFNLYVSPSIGLKTHITPNIGVMISVNDDAYLIKAFDTDKSDYRNKLVHSLGVCIGVC